MINTKDELLSLDKPIAVITQELATQIFNETGMLSLADKLNKKKVVLDKNDILEIKNLLSDKPVKNKSKKIGRPRIEEDNPTELEGHELLKYKNRIWQRQSRERRKKKDE